MDRTRLRLPDFNLTQENAGAIVRVCRKLDGMPLAIELATARMGALAVEQVAQRLEVSLDVLRADFSTVDPIRRCLPNILLQDLLHLSYKHGLGRSISTQSAVEAPAGRPNPGSRP